MFRPFTQSQALRKLFTSTLTVACLLTASLLIKGWQPGNLAAAFKAGAGSGTAGKVGAALATAAAPNWQWAAKAGGSNPEIGNGVAQDHLGNVYVTGDFSLTANFGSLTVTSNGGDDVFIAKYNSAGAPQWVRNVGGSGFDDGSDIAVDAVGNVYVSGGFSGTATFGSVQLTSGGARDGFVVKYDTAGTFQWAQKIGGTLDDFAQGLGADPAGNTYVTGKFTGTMTVGSTTLTSNGGADVFIAKFNAAGIPQWAQKGGGVSDDLGWDVAADAAGNAFVSGRFLFAATFGATTLISAGQDDIFAAKYDTAGTLQWAKQAGSPSGDDGYAIGADGKGGCYVTGRFGGSSGSNGTFGSITLTGSGGSDIFVAKYDAAGNVLWAERGGGTSNDEGRGIEADDAGNCYITGEFAGLSTFGSATTILASGGSDLFIAKYSATGVFQWVQQTGNIGGDEGQAISVDPLTACIAVTGRFNGTVSFGATALTASNTDAVVARTVCPCARQPLALFNTSYSADGLSILAPGQVDPHYVLQNTSPLFPNAIVLGQSQIPSAWLPNGPNSQWIGPNISPISNSPVGFYTYRTTFNVPESCELGTAVIAGQWATDNEAEIFLNGTSTGLVTGPADFAAFKPFVITTGFVKGANTLDFRVRNRGVGGGTTPTETGLRVELSGSIVCCLCVSPPAGMVDWWPFDETSGTTAQDIRGFANNAGTHLNGPSPSAGKVGGALCFDGVNDYVEVADQAEINFPSNCAAGSDGPLTIDTWVKTSASAGVQTILDKRANSDQPVGYSLFLVDGRLGFQMADGSAPGGTCGTGTAFPCTNFVAPGPPSPQFINVASGDWHLIAVTVTRCPVAAGKLYVDGNLVLSFTPRIGNINNNAALQIGRRAPAFSDTYLNGCLDELEFFKRALSEDEIRAIFEARSGGKCFRQPCPIPAITISPATLLHPMWGANVVYPSVNLTASGGTGPYTFAVSGNVPPGLSVDADGTLHGTPTTPGTYNFTVTVADVNGCLGLREYQIVIVGCTLTLNPAALASGLVGANYAQNLTASGGCAPYTFSVSGGVLPSGLTLSAAGVISGTPTAGGSFMVTIKVTDNCGCMLERSYPLTICPMSSKPRTYRAGNMDNFDNITLPADAAPAPRAALVAQFGNPARKNFDDPTINKWVMHSFTGLPANIVKAELEVRMQPGGVASNDSINFIFPPNTSVTWGQQMSVLNPPWNSPQVPVTYNFDLSNLPVAGTQQTNLLALLNTHHLLDIAIQDDTTVDYIKLRVWTCPPRPHFFGLPHDVLGQAQLAQDANGNLVVSNIGPSGQDGVRIDLGEAGGLGFTIHSIDIATAPVGAFKQWRMRGVVDGVPDQPAWIERHEVATRNGGTVYQVSLDSSPLGATMNEVEVFLNGIEVFSGTFPNGDVYHFLPDGPNPPILTLTERWDKTCTVHGTDPKWTIKLPNARTFTPTEYDAIVIYAQNPTKVLSFRTAVESTAAGISQTTLMNEELPVFGLWNKVLGQATFEAFGGNLTIANIGSSGQDGVMVDLGKADSFDFGLDPIDLMGAAPVGAFLQAEAFGSRNGTLNQSLGKLQATKTATDYLFTADFSNIGSTTQHIQIFNGNTQVLDLPMHTGPVGNASAWPRRIGKLGGQLECFTSDFDAGATFRIGGTSYPITQLRVLAEGATGTIEFKSGLALRGSGIGEFTLTSGNIFCPPVINVLPQTLQPGIIGVSYPLVQFSTSSSLDPFTYSVTGTLPNGMTLTPDGKLAGVPSQTGSFNFVIRAENQQGCFGEQSYTLVINCPTITINPPTLPGGLAGTPYNQPLTQTGGAAPVTWSISAGALPAGVTLSATGVLAGTPTGFGSFTFTVKVTDANGCMGTRQYIVIVCGNIVINPATLPSGQVGAAYNQPLTQTSGAGTVTWSVSAGALPNGLTLNAATGVLAGTPTTGGSFTFTVKVTDANGCMGTRQYTVIVCGNIVISPATLLLGRVGTAYNQPLTQTGGVGTITWSVSAGTLPNGLTLNATTGVLTGTPTTGGSFTFTVKVTDVNGCMGTRAYSLTVKANVVKADFDGDGKTDLSIFSPTAAPPLPNWTVFNSGNSATVTQQWGAGYAPYFDDIVPGDYDGDGKADHAIWRGADSIWYIRKSSDGQAILQFWGANYFPYFDIPTPGDYDGDGKTDIGVFRRSGTWFVRRSSDGQNMIVNHGQQDDIPVPADYDGDGKCDLAVFRPGAIAPAPNWIILNSSTNTITSIQWGAGYAPYFDTPVPADYDGDGKVDLAIWRGADSIWYIRKSSDGQALLQYWGANYAPYFDIPAPGDYDGDGKADVAVWRRSGTWFIIRSSDGNFLIQGQGQSGDIPVPAYGVRR
ncbi:MAG: putative Ig domain-containing protein [Acidobacteria bacterium]|nr:putative Ig domain-containing protein [Acidobacteriota bacterium]MBI3427635.1 putative Ig domain-containing protein [Acidobacteriota bacterium]